MFGEALEQILHSLREPSVDHWRIYISLLAFLLLLSQIVGQLYAKVYEPQPDIIMTMENSFNKDKNAKMSG